jgi:glycosyltransferase involved in cell wall biosynthesis
MPLTVLSVAYPLAKVSPGTAGGAEQVLLTLDKALVHRGYRSIVIAAAGSRCHGLLVPVRVPDSELDSKARQQARQSFRNFIRRALSEFKVDVVHMHGLDFGEYLPDADVPVIVTLHLPLSWYKPSHLTARRDNVSLVAVSGSQIKTAPRGANIDEVIPNGIELENYRPAHRRGEYALVMGRICEEKGIHLALDAAEIAHVPVVIAGKTFAYPEHRQYFEGAIRPRLGDGVQFIGQVGGMRKAQLLAGAKCLLVPSQAPETSSLSAMEAMASGTPVIAWRSGALNEIVEHGRTGWLVSTVEEMACAIVRSDEIDPTQCRAQAEIRFSAEQMLLKYMDLYNRVASGESEMELQAA